MDIRQIEYFVTTAKLASLTKAAEHLYTTQPHVSMVIGSLEKELGITLFRRRSRGVELTEEGMQVFDYAQRTLKDMDMISRAGQDTGKQWLRIVSNSSSYMASMLTDYYRYLHGQNIYLQYTECGIEEMLDRMSGNRYDLGFVFAPMDRKFAMDMMAARKHLEYVELFRSSLVLHVGQKHPLYGRKSIAPAELVNLTYIQADEDYFTVEELLGDSWKENPASHNLNRVVSTNSDHMIIQMLESGQVCNLGSYWIREKFKEHDFHMIPIEGYEEKVSFGYLKHLHHPLRPAAREFMDYLTGVVLRDGHH